MQACYIYILNLYAYIYIFNKDLIFRFDFKTDTIVHSNYVLLIQLFKFLGIVKREQKTTCVYSFPIESILSTHMWQYGKTTAMHLCLSTSWVPD